MFLWLSRLVVVMVWAALSSMSQTALANTTVPDGSLVVRLGASPVKNTVVFVWDHYDPACATAYREIIEPLKSDIDAGRLTVLLIQVPPVSATSDNSELSNAVALAMVPPQNYPALVIDWLSAKPSELSATMQQRVASALLKHWSNDPSKLASMVSDKRSYDGTLLKLRILAQQVEKTMPIRNATRPWILLNGVGSEHFGLARYTANDVRKFLLP